MKIASITYQEQAYNFVKSNILTRGYRASEYITDASIANELEISRTPVREAFHRLANEGLLINEARRGWRVYSLSLDDIREIFDIKIILEGMVARKAAECFDCVHRDILISALNEMRSATQAHDTDAWFTADEKLHHTIFTMAKNERAQQTVNNLNDQWHRLRIGFATLQSRMENSITEHQRIVDCILAHDGDGADEAMKFHLKRVQDDLTRLLENMVLPFVEGGI